MTDAPRPSPQPPKDDAPLALDKTPSAFPVTAQYVANKLAKRDGERWQPPKQAPLIVALFVGATGSAAPVLMMPEPKWNVVLASVLIGLSGALAAYFGMKSSGPKR
jgi:hypothetical protein